MIQLGIYFNIVAGALWFTMYVISGEFAALGAALLFITIAAGLEIIK